jgi:hypothetical protein
MWSVPGPSDGKGRCRLHSGGCRGPRTAEGPERSRKARIVGRAAGLGATVARYDLRVPVTVTLLWTFWIVVAGFAVWVTFVMKAP